MTYTVGDKSLKKFKIITLIIIFVLIYLNSFEILRILGNQFNKEIKFKEFSMKKPNNFDITYIYDANKSKIYMLGLLDDKYRSLFPINKYKYIEYILPNNITLLKDNDIDSNLEMKHIFTMLDYNFNKIYGFIINNEQFIAILFSDNKKLINDFNEIYLFFESKDSLAIKGKQRCSKNNCVSVISTKHKKVKLIREIINNNEVIIDTMNFEKNMIIQIIYKGFKKNDFEYMNNLSNELLIKSINAYKKSKK